MIAQTQTGLPFLKMNGLGNDFVVIDARETPHAVTPDLCRVMADRHFGVGFDQLALMKPSEKADLELVFYNADGSRSVACGNATRCIARMVMDEAERDGLSILTGDRLLAARNEGGVTSVCMGEPLTAWDEIPLARKVDTLHLPLEGDPVATSMGNPHCTFFVEDIEAVDLASFGPSRETDALFPERTNVQIAQITGPDRIRMRVWERGTGITLASGSSSCATAVAAHRRGLTGRAVRIDLDGGTLEIDWRADGVWMKGPTSHPFSGVWHDARVDETGTWGL
ncbi:diaminopimelate epimerase [Aestuariibius insulae]|uniref:diaminopimelate epimerase n=1 Tax=Aestuariibius insulae TaxID=2058287 RepID=UPI00345E37EA